MKYFVTGANRGIGLEFITQLVEAGHEVIATARDPGGADDLHALASEHEGHITIHQLDVADADSVDALVEELGDVSIDYVINNAGILPRSGGPGNLDFDLIRRAFETNTIGPLRLAEALLPHVRGGEGKKIMNLTSLMGSIEDNGSGGSYAYRISKAGLNMAMRSFAQDVKGDGIIAFVIHPGWVQTDMGGPNAKITTEESVSGMLEVLHGADASTAGSFKNYDGGTWPW